VGAENSVTSCDLHILVEKATEAVASQRTNGRSAGRGSAAGGRSLIERSVRAVGVVVLDVLLEHCREVAWAGDQEVIEAFAAQGADDAFGNRVRPGCPNGGADEADVGTGEHSQLMTVATRLVNGSIPVLGAMAPMTRAWWTS
jgi:hypothetical protein